MRERERYQRKHQNDIHIHLQIYEKSDAKMVLDKKDIEMMENDVKIKPQREPTSRNICQKYMQKTTLQSDTKTAHTQDPRWGSAGGLFLTQTIPNRQY